MNKLRGLLEIQKLGLPHPIWEFVKNPMQLTYKGEEDEYVGWTVRTCLDNGGDEFNLPHANWIKKKEVPGKIDEFQKAIKKEATFVVYPSWEFIKAANAMFINDKIIIEVVKGRLHKLLYGGDPDLHLVYSRTEEPELINYKGEKQILTKEDYECLLGLNKVIKGNKIIQWSHTTRNTYLFHDLREIK
ncbi:hypothetical protein H0N95_00810 [Candidatus Micrarchaeota archaeon]|nr:hypothetical protein [Candidatus Micrarchaeota archaeon]